MEKIYDKKGDVVDLQYGYEKDEIELDRTLFIGQDLVVVQKGNVFVLDLHESKLGYKHVGNVDCKGLTKRECATKIKKILD